MKTNREAGPFPAYLCRPSVSVAARSTEAYFVLWAHTPKGMRKLSKWESQEPARISFHLEVPRFLREVLTLRTPLNVVCRKRAFHLLSTEQRIAFAFLRSPERTLTEEEIYNAAGFRGSRIRVFEDFKGETALVGFQGYLGINIDMAVIGYFGGMPHFFLPLGHENKVFRDLWARNKQTDGFLFDSDHELENSDPSSLVPRVSEVWSFGGVPF